MSWLNILACTSLCAIALSACASTSSTPQHKAPPPISEGEVSASGFITTRHPDGSGGLRLASDSGGNGWSVDCRKDAMTDRRTCQFSNRGIFVYYGVSSTPQEICAFGHSFPGRIAQIRIDSNAPVSTNGDGCAPASKLLAQITGAIQVTTRVYTWPYDYPVDKVFTLAGFKEAIALADDLRKLP